MAINNLRPVAARPVTRPATNNAPAATRAPAPVAPRLPIKAQGPVRDVATGIGAVWGTGAGAIGGAMLGLLFAASGGATVMALAAGIPIAVAGAALGGFGGNRIGGWIEQAAKGQLHAQAPSAANLVGGTIGGFFASAGGLWGGFALGGLMGLGGALVLPCMAATAVLGAIGGGAALQALADRVAGK
ncbi:MAG: hypothetical protein JWM80_5990 [Cyanobacteria bacterium RYN_339]|nr:hypothetical protein [Cyanobacteria bacterium RYN_339]